MITFLTALLLSGTPAARAADAPADLSADANGDGEVTGKERRQKRRAARRARRAANGQMMTQEEADAADAAESSARTDEASGRAASAASALKSMMPSPDAGGGIPPGTGAGGTGPSSSPGGLGGHSPTPGAFGGTTGGAGTTGGKTSSLSSGASGDPSHPKSTSDFALAAHSGYSPAFAAAGLKLAPDGRTVLRLDGKPATADDYARLQKEIYAMPGALGRRPDFFSAISPEHYSDLKRGYKEKKDGDPIYKDVGTTEGDRDFVHTASCDKISGDCNKNIKQDSYKKGDFVAPEALDDMWSALQKELDGSAAAEQEGGGLPSLGATRAQIARETAIEAARSLTGENAGGESGAVATSSATMKLDSTPVGQAVASARRLWKSATNLAFPGSGDDGAKQGSSRWLILGAAGFAALGGVLLFLRRKG